MQVMLVRGTGFEFICQEEKERYSGSACLIEIGSEFVGRCSEEGASSGICEILLSDRV
jgi:hypothetical protein